AHWPRSIPQTADCPAIHDTPFVQSVADRTIDCAEVSALRQPRVGTNLVKRCAPKQSRFSHGTQSQESLCIILTLATSDNCQLAENHSPFLPYVLLRDMGPVRLREKTWRKGPCDDVSQHCFVWGWRAA